MSMLNDDIDSYVPDPREWASRLTTLERAANRGRGIPILRTVIARLYEERIDTAVAVVEAGWDTIRAYPEVVYVLKSVGLAPAWWV